MQPYALASDKPAADKPVSFAARFARNLAVQDGMVVAYFSVFLGALLVSKGPGWVGSVETVLGDLAIFLIAIVLVRGEILKPESYVAGLVYRAGIFGPAFLSYFQLRWILPAVSQRTLDAEIFSFDMRVFHYEPSVAWDKWVSPAVTEWFAFFYFLYFLIMAAHILPMLLFARDTMLFRHFGIATLVVFFVAHITYMIVPGFGPYHHLTFQHELVGGRFWRLVLEAVHEGGALKDIFPSLHTGAPSFLLFFSFVHRRERPFKYTWPVLAFLVSQIVIATMFLRWHYLIDIVAGLTLAAFAVLVSAPIVSWERARRERAGAQSIFGVAPLGFLRDRRF